MTPDSVIARRPQANEAIPTVANGDCFVARKPRSLLAVTGPRDVISSAGAICRTLDLPYEPPYRPVIDAASAIAYDEDLYMSGWTFVALWLDGTTVWRSPEGRQIAYRSSGGSVRVRPT